MSKLITAAAAAAFMVLAAGSASAGGSGSFSCAAFRQMDQRHRLTPVNSSSWGL
jgi:hypothetical protein